LIRCAPVDPKISAYVVPNLQKCLQLVKKKLKSGTPTGDILDAVIAGKDGPINEKVKADLAKLQSTARLANSNHKNRNDWTIYKICSHCEKGEEEMDGAILMKCQRCKLAYYCNKECQVADWKRHKETCKAISSGNNEIRSNQKTSQTTMVAFVKSNYFRIVKEVYRKSQECKLNKHMLLLEIDFYGDAPALKNEFKVWLTPDFIEESGWFPTVGDKGMIACYWTEEHTRATSDDLLLVRRNGDGTMGIQRLYLKVDSEGDEKQYFSDEAVESIGTEDYGRAVACLGPKTANAYFLENRSGY
jgi:hypothetical protein